MTNGVQNAVSGNESLEVGNLGVNDKLSLINLISEGEEEDSGKQPRLVAELFDNIGFLMNKTVAGSQISHLKPIRQSNGFQILEIKTPAGEKFGYLRMINLKPGKINCYYLVYVEVAAPYRNKGLGNRVLKHFREFLKRKRALGLLDNIIPSDDPTFDIYLNQAWQPIVDIIELDSSLTINTNFMVYAPSSLGDKNIKAELPRIIYRLNQKRAVIEMRENEMMVKETIVEFKSIYQALLIFFKDEIINAKPSALMRFMFTRFTTKFISFRRQIRKLVGYTGGESLEQIILAPEIASLPVQSYTPPEIGSQEFTFAGDKYLWSSLPAGLKNYPAQGIESLPNYCRPKLRIWLEERKKIAGSVLTIGDLLELGFDPTRLKKIRLDGQNYIFERMQARQLSKLEKQQQLLNELTTAVNGIRANNAQIKINPVLLVIKDQGNAYVLRRQIAGIHWDEAVEAIQCSPVFASMATLNIDRVIKETVRAVQQRVDKISMKEAYSFLTCFVPWNLEKNRPEIMVDFAGNFLRCVWLT